MCGNLITSAFPPPRMTTAISTTSLTTVLPTSLSPSQSDSITTTTSTIGGTTDPATKEYTSMSTKFENSEPIPCYIIWITASVGVLICVLVFIWCCIYYKWTRCCKLCSNGNEDGADLWAKRASSILTSQHKHDKDRNSLNDTEDDASSMLDSQGRPSAKCTSSGTENLSFQTHTSYPAESFEVSETPGLNEALDNIEKNNTSANNERISVIYAKPEKQISKVCSLSESIGEDKYSMLDGEHLEDVITVIPTECVYAKPMKTQTTVKEENDSSSLEPDDMKNRLSYGEGYATIKAVAIPGEQDPANKLSSTAPPGYEAVKLDDMTPSAGTLPPRLPSDTLTRPQRDPSTDIMHSADPEYAEVSVSATQTPDKPDKIVLPSASKSFSARELTHPYAQMQLAPRSQSARDRHQPEEPMVELGNPGFRKPSIRVPGSPPAVIINIPNPGDPAYADLTMPKTSEMSLLKDEDADEESGWADNIIYSSMGNDEEDISPQLVTYEQTTLPMNVNSHSNLLGLPMEDDYEEIRRSRLLNDIDMQQSDPTKTEVIPTTDSQSTRTFHQSAASPVNPGDPESRKPSVSDKMAVGVNIADAIADPNNEDLTSLLKTSKMPILEGENANHANEESGWEDNIIYSSMSTDDIEEEKSPQLVTYEQTNPINPNSNHLGLPIEDEYEEIRRSRLVNDIEMQAGSTESEVVGVNCIPTTESRSRLHSAESIATFGNPEFKNPSVMRSQGTIEVNKSSKADPHYDDVILSKTSDLSEGENANEKTGWEDNIIYSGMENDNDDIEESSPQLVTYEQTTLLDVNQTRNLPKEADYEEIQRSLVNDIVSNSGRFEEKPILTTEL